tara:strand:+ start:14750 stop:14953 length:204 start_codon:yes stop_codon:yes gene_type:complete
MSETTNFFKYVEVIEAGSAKDLASKLSGIRVEFQLNNIWSDGKKHYALINPGRPLPTRLKENLVNKK